MARDRIAVVLWAVALGVTTGVVGGALVRSPAALSAFQFNLLITAVSALALGGLLWTRWDAWVDLGAWLGFAVYFSALFVGSVVFVGVVGLLVTGGPLRTVVQLLGCAAAFGIAAWLCFYGGAAVTVSWLAARLDLEI